MTGTPRSPTREPAWALDEDAFRALLFRLDPDPDRAGLKYEALRQKLILFFAGRRDSEPEESADETLDRLTRRMTEGEDIADVGRFAYGVARRVLSEAIRRRRRRRRALDSLFTLPATNAAVQHEALTDRIGRCVQLLAAADRALILDYYAGGGRGRQDDRRDLAARLGISATALRLRAYRIRIALETCVRGGREARGVAAAPRGGGRG